MNGAPGIRCGMEESGRAIARYPTLPGDKAASRGWGTRHSLWHGGERSRYRAIPHPAWR